MQVQSLGREDPLEKVMATNSNIFAWRVPRTEEPGGLQSMGSQRVRHDWSNSTHTHIYIHYSALKRKPVLTHATIWMGTLYEVKYACHKKTNIVIYDSFYMNRQWSSSCKWKQLSCVRLFSPGQNTGVGSHSLLQGIFPIQGLNTGLLHCRQILYQLSYQGKSSS